MSPYTFILDFQKLSRPILYTPPPPPQQFAPELGHLLQGGFSEHSTWAQSTSMPSSRPKFRPEVLVFSSFPIFSKLKKTHLFLSLFFLNQILSTASGCLR